MDSQFLNIFHDDQFDGNYTKYENSGTTDLWSTENDTMSLQLSETLHGILPIAATDINVVYKCDLKDDDNDVDDNSRNSDMSTVNNNYAHDMEQKKKVSKNNNYLHNNHTHYDVTVDTKALQYDTYNDDDEDDINNNGTIGSLEQRQRGIFHNDNDDVYSISSFRTRTDSSSIGDYESHTSDYDDDDYDADANDHQNNIKDIDNLITVDNFLRKSKERTFSTNTLGSDVDGLGIDANNFDLADFITKDDILLQISSHQLTATCSNNNVNKEEESKHKEQHDKFEIIQQQEQETQQAEETIDTDEKKITTKSIDDNCDSDSDVIIDVETLEFENESEIDTNTINEWKNISQPTAEDDLLQYHDNVKADPSWNPTCKNKTKNTNIKIKEKAKTALLPTKRQCNGNVKVVAATKNNNKKTTATKHLTCSTAKATVGKNKNSNNNNKLIYGGKSLALIKQQCLKSGDAYIYSSPSSVEKNKNNEKLQIPNANETVKRKLNLEEYKKRKLCESTTKITQIPSQQQEIIPKKNKPSEEVTAVIKTLKEQQQQHQQQQQQQQQQQCLNLKSEQKDLNAVATDPLTAAKNKVLRMQALKRAQQLKIIDSKITAKVPRVTKLLPLKEIIKDTYCASAISNEEHDNDSHKNHYQKRGNSDLEEVVVLSAGCNTIISIPPLAATTVAGTAINLNSHNNSSRSLLKPLTKITHNSLISSIQNVIVQKKGLTVTGDAKNLPPSSTIGENKIIMHLPKDRHIRHRYLKKNMSIQTEYVAEFPPLMIWPSNKATNSTIEKTKITTTSSKRRRRHKVSKHRKSFSDNNNDRFDISNEQNFRQMEQTDGSMLFPHNDDAQQQNSDYYASSRSSRRHRSSVSSSSHSEYEHPTRYRRQRRLKNQRDRSSSSSSSTSSSSYSSSSSSFSSSSSKSMASRSYSRSRSPSTYKTYKTYKRNNSNNNNLNYVDRNVKRPAVEERRIVYVGRIEDETNKEMLRRKFLPYGTIKQITIHYKQTGMKFGFITYARSEDAFNVIDNGHKDPQINAYDLSFGGRRAFCRSSYADLDNAGINTYESYVFPQTMAPSNLRAGEDSFEELLKKVKAEMCTTKKSTTTATTNAESAAEDEKHEMKLI